MFTKFFRFINYIADHFLRSATIALALVILGASLRLVVVAGDNVIASTNNKRAEAIVLSRMADLLQHLLQEERIK